MIGGKIPLELESFVISILSGDYESHSAMHRFLVKNHKGYADSDLDTQEQIRFLVVKEVIKGCLNK